MPGLGSWLKVPLGKFDTERMVPLDEETVAIVDRLVAARGPQRALRHPRNGAMVDFLMVHLPSVGIEGDVARKRAGLSRLVAGEDEPARRRVFPAPFGDVGEEAAEHADALAALGDRDRLPVVLANASSDL